MEEGGCRGKTPARVPQDAKPFCISSAGGERKPSGGRFSLGEPSPGVPRCSAVRCIRLYKKAGTHRRKGVCLLFRLCRRGVGSALLSRLPGLAAPEESLYASEPPVRRSAAPPIRALRGLFRARPVGASVTPRTACLSGKNSLRSRAAYASCGCCCRSSSPVIFPGKRARRFCASNPPWTARRRSRSRRCGFSRRR